MGVFKPASLPADRPNTKTVGSYMVGSASEPGPKPTPAPEPKKDPEAADKYPKDGERVRQDDYSTATYGPGDKVPDMPIRSAAETRSQGKSPSFVGTMPFPEAPAARKPFKVK